MWQNIGVIFREKLFIILSILLAFGTKMRLIPFNACQIWRQADYVFIFYGSILQVCEKKKNKRKKMKKMSNFLKTHISGMASAIYFRPGMRSLLICWRLHHEFGVVWTGDHRLTNARKLILCYSYYYTHVVCARPVFLGHTTHYCVSWSSQIFFCKLTCMHFSSSL